MFHCVRIFQMKIYKTIPENTCYCCTCICGHIYYRFEHDINKQTANSKQHNTSVVLVCVCTRVYTHTHTVILQPQLDTRYSEITLLAYRHTVYTKVCTVPKDHIFFFRLPSSLISLLLIPDLFVPTIPQIFLPCPVCSIDVLTFQPTKETTPFVS